MTVALQAAKLAAASGRTSTAKKTEARDVEFDKHKKTPYYKALKEAVGDLRVLRDRSGYDAQS